MENREILVANTKTQKRYKLTTNATTLSELKSAMDEANIDYYGMTFTEGISKTQLLDDDTQLPQNVLYKGETTNNLVILLTNTKKNIASGANRQDAYAAIKSNNLQEVVKQKFGKNFTCVSTDKLLDVVADYLDAHPATTQQPTPSTETTKPASVSATSVADSDILDSIKHLLITFEKTGIISASQLGTFADDILDYLEEDCDDCDYEDSNDDYEDEEEETTPVSTSDGSITDDDIDDMLNELDF